MRFFLRTIFFSIFIVISCQLNAVASPQQYITMNLPDAVITQALQGILPLTIDGTSDRLEGTITIVEISNIRIKDQQLFCHLKLEGKNLHLVTQVANQNIRLKLGSAMVDFDCDTKIRYDHANKTLYIRPIARGIDGRDALNRGDIGQALLLFLNGQEFPINMQDLQPIVAQVSDKIITIKTNIVDIRAVEGALQFFMAPLVTATSTRQGAHGSTMPQ